MNIGALTMPGLGGYGYLPEFQQQPQRRSFDSFLNPRGNRGSGQTVGFERSLPLSSSNVPGGLARYAKPFRSAPVRTAVSSISESGALTLTRQSTDMTIRTRDGDLVTIRLREKEQTAAYLVKEQEKGSADGGAKTDLAYQNTREDASRFNLQAILGGNEVSDVSIEADSASVEHTRFQMHIQDGEGQTNIEYRSVTASSLHFSFEVEGSLDQEELEAIGSLLEDVDTLATEFFDGDVQVAFQRASQLGYDDSEIAGYAFNMVEQETNIVAERYRSNSDDAGMPASVSRPIAAYSDRLQRIQDTANLYFEMQVLNVMMDQIANTHNGDTRDEKEGVEASERFRAFNERILDAMLEWVG